MTLGGPNFYFFRQLLISPGRDKPTTGTPLSAKYSVPEGLMTSPSCEGSAADNDSARMMGKEESTNVSSIETRLPGIKGTAQWKIPGHLGEWDRR